MVIVTKHGAKRMRQRLGINKSSIQRMAERVFKDGDKRRKLHGKLRRYVDLQYWKYTNGATYIKYGGALYIFKGTCLITCFTLPGKL